MLNETLFRAPRTDGRQQLLQRGTRGAQELSVARWRVAAGATDDYTASGEEAIVVLQEGRGTFTIAGREWPVSRAGVFADRATAAYVPPGATLRVSAATPLEAVLVSAATRRGRRAGGRRPGRGARQPARQGMPTRARCTTSS